MVFANENEMADNSVLTSSKQRGTITGRCSSRNKTSQSLEDIIHTVLIQAAIQAKVSLSELTNSESLSLTQHTKH